MADVVGVRRKDAADNNACVCGFVCSKNLIIIIIIMHQLKNISYH